MMGERRKTRERKLNFLEFLFIRSKKLSQKGPGFA